MFVIMPTFVASIINSYFNANLRKLSLISENDLDLFIEAWIEVRTSVIYAVACQGSQTCCVS